MCGGEGTGGKEHAKNTHRTYRESRVIHRKTVCVRGGAVVRQQKVESSILRPFSRWRPTQVRIRSRCASRRCHTTGSTAHCLGSIVLWLPGECKQEGKKEISGIGDIPIPPRALSSVSSYCGRWGAWGRGCGEWPTGDVLEWDEGRGLGALRRFWKHDTFDVYH